MDKETLSNYGWIVICILVLSVMIALATPFGKYIATAVENTTEGLFNVQQKALSAADIEIMGQEFEDMLNGKPVYYGDLDKDGDIDSDDLTIIQKHMLSDGNENKELITDIDILRRADLNGDCTINAFDRLLLGKYVNVEICTFPVEDMPYYYGDVDMDGDIDEDDYNLVHQYYLETDGYNLSEEQLNRADVNADGEVSMPDATMIRGYIKGAIAFFPAGR